MRKLEDEVGTPHLIPTSSSSFLLRNEQAVALRSVMAGGCASTATASSTSTRTLTDARKAAPISESRDTPCTSARLRCDTPLEILKLEALGTAQRSPSTKTRRDNDAHAIYGRSARRARFPSAPDPPTCIHTHVLPGHSTSALHEGRSVARSTITESTHPPLAQSTWTQTARASIEMPTARRGNTHDASVLWPHPPSPQRPLLPSLPLHSPCRPARVDRPRAPATSACPPARRAPCTHTVHRT